MEITMAKLNLLIRQQSVETVMEAHALGIIDRLRAIDRILQLIDETPQAERAEFVEALRQDGRREVLAAVREWEWRAK